MCGESVRGQGFAFCVTLNTFQSFFWWMLGQRLNYESTQDRFQQLRKQYYKLKYDKPQKIIITRKKLILPSDERKILYVMASLAVIFAGTSIAVTYIMN